MTTEAPDVAYRARLAARRAAAARRDRQHLLLSNSRLAVFAIACLLAWLAFITRVLHGGWVLLPVVLFMVLAGWHSRVLRERRRLRRAVRYYEDGLARLEDRWMGRGNPGRIFRDDDHPYSGDLDLFGRGSLFELLCTARTRAGEETLAGWLTSPAAPGTVRARQEAVAALRGRCDLREDLALLGEALHTQVPRSALARWGSAPPVLDGASLGLLALGLNVLVVGTILGWWLGPLGPAPVILALTLQGVFAARLQRRVARTLAGVAAPGRELPLLAQVLARFETERFHAPLLVEMRAALERRGKAPTRRIAHLARLTDLLGWRRNQVFAPLAALLMWGTHIALALERWRRLAGPSVPGWIRAVGELEALCALAGYAYEHPQDPFAEILDAGELRLEAEGLGHPLLPEASCVRNDLRLGGGLRLLVVSGSNMSGKSTLLRSVGVNVVMALAGAPVRARRLRLAPVQVGASIRILDSLQEGRSRFYAEITRLRALMTLAAARRPLLFLLDEILHGTNSHDRLIGAEAVVKGLLAQGAAGLVTTHDLALARVADSLAPAAANIHFQDHLEEGRMIFDYRIHPGVVEKSNALALMRAVGLDV
ncbi:MAG: DNA mismatch repair protein MutS [Acidobacteriota bacterium]